MVARRTAIPAPVPPGMQYLPDFLSAEEQRALVEGCERLAYSEVRMHGVVARRTTAHFGWDYGYESWELGPAPEVPSFLLPLRKRVALLVPGSSSSDWEEVLVSRYPPGASIGWHRDAPMFGPVVIGVSLGVSARFRLRRRVAEDFEVHALELAPGSAYVLGGEARKKWQHTLSPVKGLRYSITFRTVVDRGEIASSPSVE